MYGEYDKSVQKYKEISDKVREVKIIASVLYLARHSFSLLSLRVFVLPILDWWQ